MYVFSLMRFARVRVHWSNAGYTAKLITILYGRHIRVRFAYVERSERGLLRHMSIAHLTKPTKTGFQECETAQKRMYCEMPR